MLITDIRVLKPELLTAIMQANDILEKHEAVAKIRQFGKGETSTAFHYHLALQYKDYRTQRHAPDMVFLKLTKPQQAGDFIQREVDFYNKVLPALTRKHKLEDLCLVNSYDAYFDEVTGQSHVILDNIAKEFKPAGEKYPPTQRHREQVIDALARIHAHWWEHPILDTLAQMPTEEHIADRLKIYQEKFAVMEQFPGAKFMPARHTNILKKIVADLPPRRKERLLNGDGVTLVHQDLHPGNLLYSPRESRIMDWQSWRIGTATDDLACMIVGFWPEHFRKFHEDKLLRRYYDTLLQQGVTGYSWDDLQYDYRASMVRCVSFLLAGWSKEKHVRGYWRPAEMLLDAFDHMGGMTIFE